MKKLIVSSKLLKAALSKVGQAINSKITLPILTNLVCKVTPDQLELVATNIELTIFYRLKCESKENFTFLVPYELLKKIVDLSGDCPLEIIADKIITVNGPADNFEIKMGDDISAFPKLQELPKKNSFTIETDILATLKTALVTTSKPDKNPKCALVLMELTPGKVTIASSDGSFMVYSREFEADQQDTQELLLSSAAIKVLDDSNPAKVFYHSKAIGFENDNLTLIITRSEEKFVNFRAVFPLESVPNLTLERNTLCEALDKCSLSTDQLHTTKLHLFPTEIMLFADDELINIRATINANYIGEIGNIAINSEKMLKLMSQIPNHEIQLSIMDKKRAIIITVTEDPGYKGMIMPIALPE